MNNIIVGTAGHVDHGKTSLIKMLTGIDADRLKEEKKRGITIELGFAYMTAPDGSDIGIIDVPGHEKFIKNMLAGIGGIDMVLLVVAADEGVMPQTLEHLGIMSLLNIKRGIIVISKADTAEEEWMDMVEADIRSAAEGSFLENAPCIRASVISGRGIEELKNLIFEMAAESLPKNSDPSLMRVPIDRVFTMQGFGTVVTGTLTQGMISEGQEAVIYPKGIKTRVRKVQVHGNMVEAACAGQRTAVNLSNIKKEDISRGDVLALEGGLKPGNLVDVKLNLLKDSKRSISGGDRVHLHYGSAQVLCRVSLLDKDSIKAGESCYAQLRTEEPVAVKQGDFFVIRYYSPVETIGGGCVLNPSPVKHKKNDAEVIEALKVRETGSDTDLLEQALKDESFSFVPALKLFEQLGLSAEEGESQLLYLAGQGKAVHMGDKVYIHKDYVNNAETAVMSILDGYYAKNPLVSAMPKEELRSKLLSTIKCGDIRNADRLISYLGLTGSLKLGFTSAAKVGYKVNYTKAQQKLMEEFGRIYKRAGHESPDTEEVLSGRKDGDEGRRVLAAMCADGRLTRLSPRNYMDSEVLGSIVTRIKEKMERVGFITLAELRDSLNTSRKYALMILDYCDAAKITVLQGDRRVLYR